MFDALVSWLLGHPLEGVGGLVVLSVGIAVVMIPRVHDVIIHGHPRV